MTEWEKKIAAENEKMKLFLEWLFAEVFDGNPDGCEIQEKAHEMGILESRKVDPKDERYVDVCSALDTDELYFPFWANEKK